MGRKKKVTEPVDQDVSNFLKFSIVVLLIYTPNQLHFPTSLGIPGLNVLNIIFGLVYLVHLSQKRKDPLKPYLSGRFFIVMGFMIYGFLVAQLRMPLGIMTDITYLKTGLFYPLYFFLAFHIVQSRKDMKFLVLVIMVVAAVAALEAIREALSYGIGNYQDSHRAAGPFGEDFRSSNRAGIFYSMFYPMFLSFALFASGYPKLIRWAAASGAVITVVAVFFTYSRQSYGICLLLTALLFIRKSSLMIVVLIVALANYQFWVPESAVERLEGTQQTNEFGEEGVDESTASRWVLWQGGMKMVGEMPWGIGLNRFKNEIGNFSIYSGKDAHNYYVLISAETSPLSTLFHLILVFSLIALGIKLAKSGKAISDDYAITFGIAFFGMSLAMILGNIYGSPFFSGEVMGLYWFTGGMVCRYYMILQSEVRQKRKSRRARRRKRLAQVAEA